MKRELKRRVFFFLGQWPFAIALLLLALVLAYYQYSSTDGPFLWWARSTVLYGFACAVCFIPISLLLVLGQIVLLIRRKRHIFGAALGLVLLFLINVSLFFATQPAMSDHYRYYDRTRLGEHVYRLDSKWKVGERSESRTDFSLLECDSLGVLCEVVDTYHYLNPDTGTSTMSESKYRAIKASLETDSETQTITIVINGQDVHTYSL